MILFVLLCVVLFSALDVGVVYYTRFVNRGLLDWMHDHEKPYAAVTVSAEVLICTPALAFKPVVSYWLTKWILTDAEEKTVLHAPPPSWAGFWLMLDRADGYFFIPWRLWASVWLLLSLAWYWVWRFVHAT